MPDPPVSRSDLVQDASFVLHMDSNLVILFEFANFETNLNDGCESMFIKSHDLLVDGSATIPAWIIGFDPLS